MKAKLDLLFRCFLGNALKIHFYIFYMLGVNPIKNRKIVSDLVVSLTSYGDRIRNSAPYSIFSILRQSMIPAKVVLWIDESKWSDEKLPKVYRYLMKYGLEVRYCKDIKSYTKLIPSLKAFSDFNILTIDDDVYYSKELVEELYTVHTSEPRKICCLHFCIVGTDEQKNILPYYMWEECHVVSPTRKIPEKLIFPQGYGGVLYPVGAFDISVFDIDIARGICPTADDVWFYCLSTKNKTGRCYFHNSRTRYYLVDMFRQLFKKDRLNEVNVKEADNNEVQMNKVLKHYNLKLL